MLETIFDLRARMRAGSSKFANPQHSQAVMEAFSTCNARLSHAESACNHLRGYAGQDLCHVVYAKVLHVVSYTLYSRDLYGFWSAQYHLKQWVSLQAPEQWCVRHDASLGTQPVLGKQQLAKQQLHQLQGPNHQR